MTFEQELDSRGYLCWKNVGVSMMPLLREGRDIMVIEKLADKNPKKYDAVLFRRPGVKGRGEYVLHRIIKVNADGTYWIVGDNCTGGETVKRENILGTMVEVVRNGRKITEKNPTYRIYLFLWCRCYPVRIFILKTKIRIKRILKRLVRK